MSLLSTLKPNDGSRFYKKRVGRGIGSGMGGYSTKGGKGQTQRSGGSIRRGFEGGQTPLHRRLPKFGFTNAAFATVFEWVNLDQLNQLEGEVTPETLIKAGLIHKLPVKILGRGKLEKKLTVTANAFSDSAKTAIEKAGGKINLIAPREKYVRKYPAKKAKVKS